MSSILGIDVSNHQGAVDFKKVERAGYRFTWHKVTQGVTYTDPFYAGAPDRNIPSNADNARKAGLRVGAYHFASPRSDAVRQATRFVELADRQPGDLPLVLDIEVTDGLPGSKVCNWIAKFVAEVQSLTGELPIIYTYPAFWRQIGSPGTYGCLLWIANYGVRKPAVPSAWGAFTFWQYSSRGAVPGVKGSCDLNVFAGDDLALAALCSGRLSLQERLLHALGSPVAAQNAVDALNHWDGEKGRPLPSDSATFRALRFLGGLGTYSARKVIYALRRNKEAS